MILGNELGELRRMNWIITDWFRPDIYYKSGEWRATWRGEGGGVVMNQCPHQLDLLWWLFGKPKSVWAQCRFGQWHDIEVEDDVTSILTYDNGATCTFITTTEESNTKPRL
jgi:predicted dehydrogenase